MAVTSRVFAWATHEHWLIGASLMRVSLGIWAVFFYLLHWPVRRLLWGPDGILPFDRFADSGPILNVFAVTRSPVSFEALYLLASIVAVLMVIGWRPRLVVPLHWLMIWSFQERNQLLGDGGDNLMRIVLLFLIAVNTGAHFSISQGGVGRPTLRRACVRERCQAATEFCRPLLAVVHNCGVVLIIIQLGMLYFSTGLYKVMGDVWQSGTALYYILRVDEFSKPGVADFIYRNVYLVVLGTYGTVLFEVTFVPSLLNRWSRYAIIVAGACFHAGIALVMGLVTFGWSILSVYPLLLTDREYLNMASWLRRTLRLTVFFDGWCPLCTRSVRWLGHLDLLSLVEFVSFREPGVVEFYGLDTARAARRIQSLGRGRSVREGMDTVIALAARSVVLWPLLPLLLAGRLIAGQRAYDALASRRFILIPGTCDARCPVDESPAGRA
jgi:predicted DCC family thiol-disulfide oxidoreductase YuxK